MTLRYRIAFLCLSLLLFSAPAIAEEFGGVEFPDGIRSFADVVADFQPMIVVSTLAATDER